MDAMDKYPGHRTGVQCASGKAQLTVYYTTDILYIQFGKE